MITHIHIDPSLIKHSEPNNPHKCVRRQGVRQAIPVHEGNGGTDPCLLVLKGQVRA